jgi:hypothetical protein
VAYNAGLIADKLEALTATPAEDQEGQSHD